MQGQKESLHDFLKEWGHQGRDSLEGWWRVQAREQVRGQAAVRMVGTVNLKQTVIFVSCEVIQGDLHLDQVMVGVCREEEELGEDHEKSWFRMK